jgi:Ni,Fe-hydrogenase III large subunit
MLGVRPATDERGDVAARAAVRFAEIFESLRLLREIAVGLPDSDLCVEVPPVPGGSGLGVVEGWRGEVLVGVASTAKAGWRASIRTIRPGRPGRRWSMR